MFSNPTEPARVTSKKVSCDGLSAPVGRRGLESTSPCRDGRSVITMRYSRIWCKQAPRLTLTIMDQNFDFSLWIHVSDSPRI